MKRILGGLSKEIIGLIFLLILISPLITFTLYQKSNAHKKSLTKVCGAYEELIKNLRNETTNEEITRLRRPFKLPNKDTIEGRYENKVRNINSAIRNECEGVFTTFPSYDEFISGYSRN